MKDLNLPRRSALLSLLIVLAIIVFVEVIIMGIFRLYVETENEWLDVIMDAILLAAFTFPSLYYMMLRPLELQVIERQKAEEELRRAKEQLEQMLIREQQLSRVDGMTGLFNYRHFFEFATHEFILARRYQRPLTVLMCDTDDFKKINDTLGHAAGDRMLSLVAQAAGAHMRAGDMLARYGGDEFIIMLSQTNLQQAYLVAERIREKVTLLGMETEKGRFSVTFSLGVADMRQEPGEDSVEAIIQRADQALYLAKQGGRNRTVLFSEDNERK